MKCFRSHLFVIFVFFVAGLSVSSVAQTPQTFDVSSVKLNTSGRGGWNLSPMAGGRFSAQNVSLRQVVLYAYGLRDFQLVNDPGWLQSSRFDIDARAAGDVPMPSMRELVKTLLRDRFGFIAHFETRDLPMYTLVMQREGELGPALKRPGPECDTARKDTVRVVGPCAGVITDANSLAGGGVPIAMLANSLSGVLNSVVVDKTGLAGEFSFELRWSDAAAVGADRAALSDAPALTTAVQEQLGLRLQPQRGPVQVLVVDRVSQPTEN